MSLREIAVIIGHFRGHSRGVCSPGWGLDVSASQTSRRKSEKGVSQWAWGKGKGRGSVCELEGRGGAFGEFGTGWGRISGPQVLRRKAAVCNQLSGLE